MPLYEYECDRCSHRFETIQKFSDAPVAACPKCGGPVHKMQSSPAFHFKGTGWYVTDYAKKDQSSGSSKSDSGKKDSASEKAEKAEKAEKKDGSREKSDAGAKTDKPVEKPAEKSDKPAAGKD